MQPDRQGRAAAVVRAVLLAVVLGLCALFDVTAAAPVSAHGVADGVDAPATDVPDPQGEPLSAADRDLLEKVRLAGLWETPAGQLAARKGASPRVREIGAMIGSQHRQLDALVLEAAAKLGVTLPVEPDVDQKRWLREMADASGDEFDRIFVDRLRAAHGNVFPAIAKVRAGTRNSVVRQFASTANGFVLTHLTLLESTGLVEYGSLARTPAPPASTGTRLASLADSVTSFFRSPPWYAGIILPIAVLLAVPRILRAAVRRQLARRPSRTYPPPPPPTPRQAPPEVLRRLPSPYSAYAYSAYADPPLEPTTTTRRLRTSHRSPY